jgi:hypothetical protein
MVKKRSKCLLKVPDQADGNKDGLKEEDTQGQLSRLKENLKRKEMLVMHFFSSTDDA